MTTTAKRSHRSASHEARAAALQMLYALELGGQTPAQVERWYLAAHPLEPAVRERAGALLDTAVGDRELIEAQIVRHAQGWKLERISVIERSILKLAAAELRLGPPPAPAAVIEAALALTKTFSHPGAVPFVHGMLDAMAHEPVPSS